MLDIKYIRENLDSVRQSLLKRMDADKLDLDSLLLLDDKRKSLLQESESLKAEGTRIQNQSRMPPLSPP